MNYLTLNLTYAELVLSDNSVWKNLNTWLNGGTAHSDYYDASNSGDYWGASKHWINIDSNSTYLTFTIEYEFVNAIATYSSLCQIRFDELSYGGVTVIADTTGLSILTPTVSKYINCDYSNANIKIDITANLVTKEITTYIHKDYTPLVKAVSSSNYSFTKFLIQAGSKEYDVYRLPTTTKLLNVSVSDDAISYPNFSERELNYVNKRGLAEVWANIKNWVLAHIGNGTLTINVNGQTYTFQANQATDVTINIPRQGGYYGIDFYGLTPYGGEDS